MRSVGAPTTSNVASSSSARLRAPILGRATQACQVDELLEHPHLRIQPSLLRHVAEAAAHARVDPLAAPADLPRVGLQDTERDPHGGRLPRPVAPHETDDAALGDLEGDAVERNDVAESAPQIDQLEHVGQG